MKQSIKEGIDRYIVDHIPTGGFLYAVLSNDLFHAIIKADEDNLATLIDIVWYVQNNVPVIAHGSPEKVKAWLESRTD